jgi:transposase
MTDTLTRPVVEPSRELPRDLRQWAEESRLIRWALDAAHSAAEQMVPVVMPAGGAINRQMMLTLLAYCYASGIHGSEDIEWASQNDPHVGYICGKSRPDSRTIRQFRRANRQAVEHCLVHVFTLALEHRVAESQFDHPGHSRTEAGFYHNLFNTARRRLELAVLMDTAACE